MLRRVLVGLVCVGLAFSSLSAQAAPVSWVSGAGGDWLTATNWSSNPALPGITDQVTINQPGTLTITLSATAPEINSLTMNENLQITTPSNLVVGSGGGSISGTINLQNGRLFSKTGTLNILNTVNSDVSGLAASSGGKMLFAPGVLTTINGRSDLRTTLEAEGASGLLDLSGVTTFNGGSFVNALLLASNGGKIEMENVASIINGATFVEATGTNSRIDLTALTAFSRSITTDVGELRATAGGVLVTPNLTTISNRINVQVDGTTSSIGLSNVTSADTVSFRALNGGVVSLNSLTSYIADNSGSTFRAAGTGSKVDMSALTNFDGGTFVTSIVQAESGGLVEMENVTTLDTGAYLFDATAGGTINLSALTTLTRTNFADTARLRATGGGTILTPNLSSIGTLLVEVDGAASSVNLASLTSVDGTSFVALNGGTVAPTALAAYSGNSGVSNIFATGTGSLVDMSSVTTFSGGTFNRTNVIATGGRVELDNVAQIVTGITNIEANDGGRVVLTDLTTFSRSFNSDTGRLRATNGGTIESPNLALVSDVTVEVLGATSTIDFSSLASATATNFTASNGGVISAPAMTSYAPGALANIRAESGGTIDFSGVTNFQGGTFFNTDVFANGGTIDLDSVTSLTTGATDIRATNGGQINLSSLTTIAPNYLGDARILLADTNGTIQLNTAGTTTISNTEISINTNGELHGQEIELSTGANFQAIGTVEADLTNSAGTLRPGFNNQTGTLDIEGDFKQSTLGSLRIDASSVLQHDVLNIDGDANLGGNLHITPLSGFTPVYGADIDIINVTGSITGEFNSITWDGFFGWRAEYLPNIVRLIAEFGADFDEDGDVDSDDLVVWQGNYSMSGAAHTDGDANDDGAVNARDFLIWQRQFTGPGPLADALVVPEPGIILLLLPGVFAICTRRCGIKT
jgi:hypothetical protein